MSAVSITAAHVVEVEPRELALERKALYWPTRARELKVYDQNSYDLAADCLRGIKILREEIEATFGPICRKAFEAHREAVAQRKKVEAPLEEAEATFKASVAAFLREQERISQEAERIAREEAERIEAERLEAAIEAAEQDGATAEEVAAMIEQPIIAPAVSVAPTVQQASGISMAKTYRVEVVNLRELCKAVATGQAPESYVAAAMPALNGVARATKGAVRIPGCRVVEDSVVRASGRGR